MKPVAIISGASTGMGFEAMKIFTKNGYQVYGGARHIDDEHQQVYDELGAKFLPLDVSDSLSVKAFVDHVIKEENQIDVLINNAGFGQAGALEEVTIKEAKNQFDVNLFGVADLTNQVLPIMRKQHSGKIVNISSVGGQMYSQLLGWYYASKHALETYSDTLRLEVKPFGIDVIIIEPGGTATNWGPIAMDNLEKNTPADSPYRPLVEKYRNALFSSFADNGASGGMGMDSATDVAQLFYDSSQVKNPKTRYQPGLMNKAAVVLFRKASYHFLDRGINFVIDFLAKRSSNNGDQPQNIDNN